MGEGELSAGASVAENISSAAPEIASASELFSRQEVRQTWDTLGDPTDGLIAQHADEIGVDQEFFKRQQIWREGTEKNGQVVQKTIGPDGEEIEETVSGSDLLKETIDYTGKLVAQGIEEAKEPQAVFQKNARVYYTGEDGKQHVATLDEWEQIPNHDELKSEHKMHHRPEETSQDKDSAKPEETDEQKAEKEQHKQEIVKEMRTYATSLQDILKMHYEKKQQFYGTPAQQGRIIAEIERFYPELTQGEVTDEQLLEMRMRDNTRELYIISLMEKDENISDALIEALQGDKGFLNGENKLLESLGVVSGKTTRDESLELQALFEKKEQGYQFRKMRLFIDKNGPEIQKRLAALGIQEKRQARREMLVNSGLTTAFIMWLIASQMLEGDPQQQYLALP
ncbi:hypothetical protein HY469_01785 [Candidatus Roizmanbacteria bacterium]|nr:hypothetical protein [Candidatus Roizmanbacteria bacterium]